MQLKDGYIGMLVQLKNGDIGHITGLSYNIRVRNTGGMPIEELKARTIFLVRFPDGSEIGVYPANLEKLN